METLIHRSPSVGKIIKQITEINPALKVNDVIHIIKQSVEISEKSRGEFNGLEIINETKALRLAKASTLTQPL